MAKNGLLLQNKWLISQNIWRTNTRMKMVLRSIEAEYILPYKRFIYFIRVKLTNMAKLAQEG